MRWFVLLAGLAFIPSLAIVDEKPVQLKAAPGLETVEANCSVCHSLAYIEMNSPFLDAAHWEAEVTKMTKTYGAPINPADAKIILDYLTQTYGG